MSERVELGAAAMNSGRTTAPSPDGRYRADVRSADVRSAGDGPCGLVGPQRRR
ncbi:hypothetical protein P3L51_00660 [Streptomyces sp. PSRA5]|uniref:hypothetical protein n=1 Tax=Streptomyces panacea TaxID=3035064 RepID=UPI00339C572B